MDEVSRFQKSELKPRIRPYLTSTEQKAQVSPDDTGQLFDFGSIWRLLLRRKFLIASVVSICILAAVIIDALTPDSYTARARILLDEQSINPFGKDEIFSDLDLGNPTVESQIEVIRSPLLLSRVVEKYNLADESALMAPPLTPLAEQLVAWREEYLPWLSEPSTEPTEAETFEAAVDRLRRNVRVSRNAETLIIRIQHTSTSPQFAADVANIIAENYIDNLSDTRQDIAAGAAQWFDERISELNERAAEVEQRMERLSRGEAAQDDASRPGDSLQNARQALQSALASRAEARSEAQRLQVIIDSGRGLQGVPSDLSSSLSTLALDAETLRVRLQNAEQQGGDVAFLSEQLASVEEAGANMLSWMLENAESEVGLAENAVIKAEAALGAAQNDGGAVSNSIDLELRSLRGEARIYRELNERYLESYLQVAQQQSFPSSQATIIETATVPEFPSGVGLKDMGVFALLVGTALGVLSAFAVEARDRTVRTAAQLVSSTGAPLLGILPTDAAKRGKRSKQKKPPKVVSPSRRTQGSQKTIVLPENRVSLIKQVPLMYESITNPLSTFSETIRRVNVEAENLRNALGETHERVPKCIGFVSDKPSNGRSMAAVNYAEMLAVSGERTLLIDLDWAGAYLSELITPAAQLGFAELALTDIHVPSQQAFWYDEASSLYFLPNRAMSGDVALHPGVFSISRMKSLILSLSENFDNVVLDLSPMALSTDPAGLSDVLLGYVAVAEWGTTETASLKDELRRAKIQPPALFGTLLYGVGQKKLGKYERPL